MEQIKIRLSEADKEAIRVAAESMRISMAAFVRLVAVRAAREMR